MDYIGGGNFDHIKELVAKKEVNQTQLRFYVGYVGWTENQLESEVVSNVWVSTDLTIPEIMIPDTTKLWKQCVVKLGQPYSEWAKYPSDPRMN